MTPSMPQVRKHEAVAEPAPEDFKEYKNNAGGEKAGDKLDV